MKKGIDISKWNGKIDFSKVKKSEIDFVIIREGYRKQTDPRFLEYVEESKKAGIVVLGIYHFLYTRSVEDAFLEAQSAVSNAKKAGLKPDEIIIFSDYEYDTVNDAKKAGINLTKEDCNAHVQAFCSEITRLGYKAGIYTNLDYYRHHYSYETISKYPIWLADYKDEPDFPCIVQQYTNKGSVLGISGNVDMNYYYGDFKMDEEVAPPIKSVEEVANEVLSGLWGNGIERKNALISAGYIHEEIQQKVNEIIERRREENILYAACRTILGEYGTGEERRKSIELLGLAYEDVQKLVNMIVEMSKE